MASPAPPPPLLDPVALLTTALSAPESEQRGHLLRAKAVLELQPSQIQTIVGYILPFSTAPGLISDWMVELVELAVCRSNLSVDIKTQLCVQSLDTLANLLPTAPLKISKILVQIFSSLYPLVFRYLWTNRTDSQLWTTLSKVKQRILRWATLGTDEDGRPIKKGQRVQAIKFLQKAVLVQTKGPNDPRLRVAGTDPNLSQCPSDHPFLSVSELEAEGNKLLEFILLALYTSTDVDVLTSVVNTLPVIIKLRPALSVVFIPALTGWTPEPINGLSRGDIRSVEKVVKVTMSYLEKSPFATAHKAVLQAALGVQSARMEAAYKLALEESRVQIQKRKLDETAAAASSLLQPPKAKRPRWDVPSSSSTPPPPPPTLPTPAGPSSSYPPFPPQGRGGPPFPPQGMPPPTLHQPGIPPPPPHPSYQQQPPPPQASAPSIYNVAQLPIELVIDLLVANLSAVSEQALVEAVRDVRRSLFPDAAQQPPPLASFLLRDAVLPPGGGGPAGGRGGGGVNPNGELKREEEGMDLEEEAVNPMDLDDGDEEEEVEVSAEELERLMVQNKKRKQPNSQPDDDLPSGPSPSKPHPLANSTPNPTAIPKFLQFQLSNFALPPPTPLPSSARQALALKALKRIWEAGSHLSASSSTAGAEDEEIQSSAPARDLWMMLGARLVTRGGGVGLENVKIEGLRDGMEEEESRRTVCQFVVEDFGERYKFATLWLNEEWYNDSQLSPEDERRSPLYRTSLLLLSNLYLPRLSGTYLSRFILDLPDVPLELLSTLQTLCTDPDRSRGRVGLKTLRDLVIERPPLRAEALRNLLELCTHPDAGTRNPAIATVRAWVPDNKPWSSTIRTFALQVLRRLQAGDAKEKTTGGEMDGVVPEEDDKLPEKAVEEADQIAQSQYLPVKLEMPIEQEVVRQHVELMFALTKKIPEFLDEIFAAYGTLSPSIQESFQQILAPLIKSLGPNHGKLLTLLRTFPPGADSLALRTLQILSEPKDADTPRVKLSVPLVALVKSLVAERDLDPRFILPIIPELEKTEVKKHLPWIVSLLNGKTPERDLVRGVIFQLIDSPESVLPPNTPRMRPGQRFTPAELLVLLHRFEKEGGLKPTMEAIDICFSMTEVYKSEVLGVVLQQISDEPELPTLFLRTVIKSVQTYKSLTPFVATNLLSRLITKKIWTSPQLWEGFIRVAKMLNTSSYPALLQLPRDQLKEIVGREDGKAVKAGLREFVLKKAGGNAARLPAWFGEVFGDQVLPTAGSESPGPTADPLLALPGLTGGGDSPLSSAPTTPGGAGGETSNGATEMVM